MNYQSVGSVGNTQPFFVLLSDFVSWWQCDFLFLIAADQKPQSP